MTSRFALLLVAVCLSASCVDTRRQIRVGPVKMMLRHAQLPSGAKVVLEEAPGSGSVAVVLIVGAGSAEDPKGKEGLAHFVEHLAFRSKPAGQVTQWQAYELLGASSFNAETLFDDTRFTLVGQPRLAPQLVSLVTQQLAYPVANIDPRVFEVERGVVLSEYLEHAERSFNGETMFALQKALFPADHPYSRPFAGTPETIAAITPEDVQAWTAEHYLPNNATLVITGDFDAAAIEPAIVAALPESWKAAPKNPASAVQRLAGPPLLPDPPARAEKLPVVHAAVQRSNLVLAWTVPAAWVFDAPEEFLGAGISGALNRHDRDEVSDALYVRCGTAAMGSVALLTCSAPLMTGLHPQETLAQLEARITKWEERKSGSKPLRLGGGPDTRVAQLYVAELFRLENVVTRASDRAERLHYTGDPFALTKRIETFKRPEHPDLATLEQFVTHERMRALLVEPIDVNAPPSFTRVSGVGEKQLEVNVGADAVREEAEGPPLAGLRRFTLPNGLPVLVVPRPAMPVAVVELALPGGTGRGEKGAAWVAQMYATYESQAGLLAGDTDVEHRSDVTLVRFVGGNGNVEQLLGTAQAWLTLERGTQTIENARDYYDKRLQELQLSAADHENDLFVDQVYRGSRLSPVVERDVLSKVSIDAADAWRAAAFQPQRSALIITGDIDPGRMRALAEKYLGDWKGKDQLPPPLPEVSFEARPTQVLVNHHPKSGVVTLSLGCLMPAVQGQNALAPAVVERLLRTRLQRLWRTQLGISYGVTSYERVDARAVALFIESEIDPRRLTTVLRTLKSEWDQAQLPPKEIAMARWTTARERSTLGSRTVDLGAYFGTGAVRTQDLLGAVEQEHHLADLPDALVQQEFDVCKGTTVLRLDGERELIDKALHDANQ